MIAHGSAFPVAKLALNNSVPPILMASLRMGLVFLLLMPSWKFKLPNKKFFKPLILFSISMAGIGLTVAFKDLKVSAVKISIAVLASSILMIIFAIIGISAFNL